MTTVEDDALTRYTRSGRMTSPGRYATLLERLPPDIPSLTTIGHGLLIHEHIAGAYDVTLEPENQANVHLRRVEAILERVVAADARPLDLPRDPAARTAANCRQFTVLLESVLRTHGIPARARCGFGNYFGNGLWEDHWIAEYWNAGQQRWVLVDAQIDARQREMFGVDFDVTDVPRDRFRVAGDAWLLCRAGADDPGRYGLSLINEAGLWWIAGNLMRDAAALLGIELLPWDVWGAMPGPSEQIDDERLDLFDRLGAMTVAAGAPSAELEELFRDERLRVPAAVRNALRARDEAI